MQHITIGTRASKLAMKQTQWIAQRLHQQYPDLDITIEQISTTGDRVTNIPLSAIGGDGVFVTEIERALQEKRIDLALHSLKDLPTMQPEGLQVVVVGPREDVRDALVVRKSSQITVDTLHRSFEGVISEQSLRIGTCSLRRTAQLRALAPATTILSLRGNVDTRLRKLEAGQYDAIVLAAAGLHRLGLSEQLAGQVSYFSREVMLSAPGQGALALECRQETAILKLLEPLRDHTVQAATEAERMFMRRLGAGCYLPVAAYGSVQAGHLIVHGLVSSLDGQQRITVQKMMPWNQTIPLEAAQQLGMELAEAALDKGADQIIRALSARQEQEDQHV